MGYTRVTTLAGGWGTFVSLLWRVVGAHSCHYSGGWLGYIRVTPASAHPCRRAPGAPASSALSRALWGSLSGSYRLFVGLFVGLFIGLLQALSGSLSGSYRLFQALCRALSGPYRLFIGLLQALTGSLSGSFRLFIGLFQALYRSVSGSLSGSFRLFIGLVQALYRALSGSLSGSFSGSFCCKKGSFAAPEAHAARAARAPRPRRRPGASCARRGLQAPVERLSTISWMEEEGVLIMTIKSTEEVIPIKSKKKN